MAVLETTVEMGAESAGAQAVRTALLRGGILVHGLGAQVAHKQAHSPHQQRVALIAWGTYLFVSCEF